MATSCPKSQNGLEAEPGPEAGLVTTRVSFSLQEALVRRCREIATSGQWGD